MLGTAKETDHQTVRVLPDAGVLRPAHQPRGTLDHGCLEDTVDHHSHRSYCHHLVPCLEVQKG